MSRSLSRRQVILVPIWLMTSESMALGRWSITIRVTLYLRISLAMLPKMVWEATAGLRKRWASSMQMTRGRGSVPVPPSASSLR